MTEIAGWVSPKYADKCAREGLHIMKGNKIIEIKPVGCDKGYVAKQLLLKEDFDFMLAIGDDTTDEDMFREMPKDSYTIKVGEMSDAARFYLKNQHEVLPLLNLFLSD